VVTFTPYPVVPIDVLGPALPKTPSSLRPPTGPNQGSTFQRALPRKETLTPSKTKRKFISTHTDGVIQPGPYAMPQPIHGNVFQAATSMTGPPQRPTSHRPFVVDSSKQQEIEKVWTNPSKAFPANPNWLLTAPRTSSGKVKITHDTVPRQCSNSLKGVYSTCGTELETGLTCDGWFSLSHYRSTVCIKTEGVLGDACHPEKALMRGDDFGRWVLECKPSLKCKPVQAVSAKGEALYECS